MTAHSPHRKCRHPTPSQAKIKPLYNTTTNYKLTQSHPCTTFPPNPTRTTSHQPRESAYEASDPNYLQPSESRSECVKAKTGQGKVARMKWLLSLFPFTPPLPPRSPTADSTQQDPVVELQCYRHWRKCAQNGHRQSAAGSVSGHFTMAEVSPVAASSSPLAAQPWLRLWIACLKVLRNSHIRV